MNSVEGESTSIKRKYGLKGTGRWNLTTSWPHVLRISFIKDSAALRTSEDLSF